jgi:hypothetical protein
MGTQLYGGLKNLGAFSSSGISANPFMATSP